MERIEPEFYECVQRNGNVSYRVILRYIKGEEPYHRETFLYLSGSPIVRVDTRINGEETRFESLDEARAFAKKLSSEYLAKLNPYEVLKTTRI